MAFRTFTHRAGAVAAALAFPSAGRAQGIFQQAGTAAQEGIANFPIMIAAACLAGGGFLLYKGGWTLYTHWRYGSHHGQGQLALAAASAVAGFIIVNLTTFALLGSTTFLGGAPTTGAGAAVTF